MHANPQLARFSANTQGRDFSVGDIHGYFSALQRALDSIQFKPEHDRLFSVGDLVNRGPESHLVLEWLNRPWFHAICGNHDFMIWRSALGDPYLDVNHLEHGGTWTNILNASTLRSIGERLAALPLAMEVETPQGLIGLVHADCPYDHWHLMQQQPLSPSPLIAVCGPESAIGANTRPIKPIEAAHNLPLPDGSLTEQGRAVLAAVASGELPTTQGTALLNAIGALARVAELDELTTRIAALEASATQKRSSYV